VAQNHQFEISLKLERLFLRPFRFVGLLSKQLPLSKNGFQVHLSRYIEHHTSYYGS
jgi:hypothetical protein